MKNRHKPKEICIEITDACFLNCLFCSSNASQPSLCSKYLPIELFESIVEEFKRLGGKEVQLSGGEPLLHPNVSEFVTFCVSEGLKTVVYTSGYADSAILKKVVLGGVSKIVFNLQGMSETHDLVTGVHGAFISVIEKIELCKKLNVSVEVHFVPNRVNYSSLK